jgi:hypothetical protein
VRGNQASLSQEHKSNNNRQTGMGMRWKQYSSCICLEQNLRPQAPSGQSDLSGLGGLHRLGAGRRRWNDVAILEMAMLMHTPITRASVEQTKKMKKEDEEDMATLIMLLATRYLRRRGFPMMFQSQNPVVINCRLQRSTIPTVKSKNSGPTPTLRYSNPN